MEDFLKELHIFLGTEQIPAEVRMPDVASLPDAGSWDPSCSGFEITGTVHVDPNEARQLMDLLSRTICFDRKTIRRLFHAVTHHRRVWFDVVTEFKDGTVDKGGIVVDSPRQLRLLLKETRHIRMQYRISDRDGRIAVREV